MMTTDQAWRSIQNSDIDMDGSAASKKPAKNATEGEVKKTSSDSGSRPGASGGSAVRKGNAK